MHQLIWNKQTAVFRWIHRLLKELGTDILCLRFGSVNVIVVACPEIALEVARKNDAVFVSRPTTFASETFSFGYMGSILTPAGEQWKKMRRVISTEILSPALLNQLHHLREEEIDHMVMCIYNTCNSNNTIVNVRHVVQHLCCNMIRKLMFSKRYFSERSAALSADGLAGPDEEEHVAALFTLLSHVYSFSISDYFPSLVGLNLDGHEKVAKRVMRTLNRLHDPIIEERMQESSILQKGDQRRGIRDFLDVLVSLEDVKGQPLLSFQEIRATTAEIMFATIDNPSNVVEWALAEMINKPEVMKKAIDELDKVVADTTIASYTVTKGSHVLISRIGLGRNTEHREKGLSRHITWYVYYYDTIRTTITGIYLDEASKRGQNQP
ncbi:hypothetical protein GUJ93_ZPchr0003g17761 [Zizania palustris]|uniref:Uncharacterized protein n=1 Tax=Zizania palustris TaxID=103762 RepID=A0A8J5RYJ8_ZIZPA|nr:hypothetical protein GUJ93_ZPchr0003g17761 [Zizania palustris]